MKYFLGRLVIILSTLFIFHKLSEFCHQQTAGFQVVKIISHLPPSLDWQTPVPTVQELDTLKSIFSRPFSYLGSGGQSYAFVSEEGDFVLKLFKMHNIRQYPFLYQVALPGILDRYRIEFLKWQKQKLERVFSSSQLAHTRLKEECGLLFLNLNPSQDFKPLKVVLIDKIGIEHCLSLENIPFAIQYRANSVFKTLRLHLLHQDLQAGKKVIKQTIECLLARYQKRIADLDPELRRNLGLLNDKAIVIDIGSFILNEELNAPDRALQELKKDTRRMRKWLLKRSPELADYLDSLISESYSRF